MTVPHTARVRLCVQIAASPTSTERGQAAQWIVSAWTTGGSVPDATIQLHATPATGGAPGFSFGCGSYDGTSSCDLGTMDAKSAQRQLQAQLTVPVTASTVRSVIVTVIASAAHLPKSPKASATVTITAPPAPVTAPPAPTTPPPTRTSAPPVQTTEPPAEAAEPQVPATGTSPLPVTSLPGIPAVSPTPSSTLSPGGDAATLFPTLYPKPAASPAQKALTTQKAGTHPIANTSALPEGAPIVGAQLVGLAALALAFVLAVTRLSVRRPSPTSPSTTQAEPPTETPVTETPATDPRPSGSAGEPAAGVPDKPGDSEPAA